MKQRVIEIGDKVRFPGYASPDKVWVVHKLATKPGAMFRCFFMKGWPRVAHSENLMIRVEDQKSSS